MINVLPGYALALLILMILVVLGLRLADQQINKKRSHLVVIGGSLAAFMLVVRFADALARPAEVMWSAVAGAFGMLIYLAAELKTYKEMTHARHD